ncbi:MAG: SRPBCC family protein [Pseudonocardiaceae bacterium]
MAVLNVLIDRDSKQVWSVLSDGWSYSEWVVGTQRILHVDADWPASGSRLQYAVGVSRWTVEDVTTVRLVDPERRLELEANAGRLGSARVSIELLPWGENHTLVILDEHPLSGPGARLHSAVVEVLLRFRNQRMVRALARVVRDRHPR